MPKASNLAPTAPPNRPLESGHYPSPGKLNQAHLNHALLSLEKGFCSVIAHSNWPSPRCQMSMGVRALRRTKVMEELCGFAARTSQIKNHTLDDRRRLGRKALHDLRRTFDCFRIFCSQFANPRSDSQKLLHSPRLYLAKKLPLHFLWRAKRFSFRSLSLMECWAFLGKTRLFSN